MTQQNPLGANSPLFKLEYPQSLGVFGTYAEAQKAVDHLADNDFPVGNLAIVGTDLRLVERVTGRRSWATVLRQGITSGLMTGMIVGLLMVLLFPSENFLSQLGTALVIGVVIGLLFAVIGYALSRGQRDFTSVSQTIATKYELLCEHKVVAQARELLSKAPGVRAAQFNQPPSHAQQPWPQGHPGQWGGQQGHQGQQGPQGQWGGQPWPPQGGHYPPPQGYPQQPHSNQQPPQPPQPPSAPSGPDPDGPYRPPSSQG